MTVIAPAVAPAARWAVPSIGIAALILPNAASFEGDVHYAGVSCCALLKPLVQPIEREKLPRSTTLWHQT
jgi:hypothetical protein